MLQEGILVLPIRKKNKCYNVDKLPQNRTGECYTTALVLESEQNSIAIASTRKCYKEEKKLRKAKNQIRQKKKVSIEMSTAVL